MNILAGIFDESIESAPYTASDLLWAAEHFGPLSDARDAIELARRPAAAAVAFVKANHRAVTGDELADAEAEERAAAMEGLSRYLIHPELADWLAATGPGHPAW